jgi:hypothetical protein
MMDVRRQVSTIAKGRPEDLSQVLLQVTPEAVQERVYLSEAQVFQSVNYVNPCRRDGPQVVDELEGLEQSRRATGE